MNESLKTTKNYGTITIPSILATESWTANQRGNIMQLNIHPHKLLKIDNRLQNSKVMTKINKREVSSSNKTSYSRLIK